MSVKFRHYIFLVIGLIGAYILSYILITNLFVTGTPLPAWNVFEAKASITRENLLASIKTWQTTLTKSIPQNQTPTTTPLPPSTNQNGYFDMLPAPTAQIAPTTVPIPTQLSYPTKTPSSPPVVYPTTPHLLSPQPSLKPTKTPKPTSAPNPTNPPVQTTFPKVSGDPLKQKWYGNGSLACYTTERFIQVYANGLTSNKCYANIKAYVDSSIVSTTLLGRSIQVHKKALPAFEAVAKTLDQYKIDSSTYKFPSKTYKIKNVGAYVFRCNVNASTSGKNDVCSDGCKLSPHAFGIAVDINYDENCNGCKNYDMPKEISDTFESFGFRWGGHYPLIGSYIDPMHFEYMRDLCEGV